MLKQLCAFLRPALALTIFFLFGCGSNPSHVSSSPSLASNTPNGSAQLNGQTLYANNCAACHGGLQTSQKKDRSVDQIGAAITGIPEMRAIRLSAAEINAISVALVGGGGTLPPPSTPRGPLYSCPDPAQRGMGNTRVRRLQRQEVIHSLTTFFGQDVMSLAQVQTRVQALPLEPVQKGVADPAATFQLALAYTNLFSEVSAAVMANTTFARRIGGDCAVENPDLDCLRGFINNVGLRLHRRPLVSATVTDHLTKLTTGTTAGTTDNERFRLALMRLLLAPDFMFKIEEGAMVDREQLILPSMLTRSDGVNTFPGSATTTVINGNEWITWINSPGLPETNAIYNKVYEKVIVVASATPGADGVYPSIRFDWNHVSVVNRPDLTRVNGANKIFVFDGNFGFLKGVGNELHLKQKIGINMIGNAGSTGASLTIQSIVLIDQDSQSLILGANTLKMKLAPLEVASRIAMRASSSVPDQALLAAALKGQLTTAAAIESEALRAFATPAGRQVIVQLFKDWTRQKDLPGTGGITPANATGLVLPDIEKTMTQEFGDFVEYQVVIGRKDFTTLMSSPTAFPKSASLASIYGVGTWNGDFNQPQLSTTHRGLLNRAAFLYSGRDRGSPILRGVAVRTAVLCDDLATPSPDIINSRDNLLNGKVLDQLPTRELVALQTGSDTCMTCHTSINPLGFGFENFDGLGRYRTTETIYNTAGTVASTHPVNSQVTGLKIETGLTDSANSVSDLIDLVTSSSKSKACLSRNFVQLTAKRTLSNADNCVLSDVENAIRTPNRPLIEALASTLANEDIFYAPRP